MNHVLTMHTTNDRALIWVTCSCGWKPNPRAVGAEDWDVVERRVGDEGAAHRRLALALEVQS